MQDNTTPGREPPPLAGLLALCRPRLSWFARTEKGPWVFTLAGAGAGAVTLGLATSQGAWFLIGIAAMAGAGLCDVLGVGARNKEVR